MKQQRGFSLIELMVAVAILSIVAAVAIPMYTSYVDSGRDGALTWNIATLEIFQEDIRLQTGAYAGGTYEVTVSTLSVRLGPSYSFRKVGSLMICFI